MTFVFLVIVPVLTMRVLAEERKQKTDRLLYSLPVSMAEVVLGKYLAMAVVLAVPMAIISIYPLVLSCFGTIHFAQAYSALLAFYCLGLSLLAIGTFVSSVTESQAVAAGLCFVVMLINYFLSDLAGFVSSSATASYFAFAAVILIGGAVFYHLTRNGLMSALLLVVCQAALIVCYVLWSDRFVGLFPAVMQQLSLFDRFYVFLDGVFDVTGLLYFLSVAGVFLFLSVQSMEKRRWSQ